MSEKALTHKQLIRKASSKVSAKAFLDAHSAYVRATYPEAGPVLEQFEAGSLLPSPTLDAIKVIIQNHIILALQAKNAKMIESFEADKDKPAKAPSGTRGAGRYTVQFFVKVTNERTGESTIERFVNDDGTHSFLVPMYQDAMHLVDRKQNEMMDAVYASISSIENGKVMTTAIPRADSVARANKKGASPAMRKSSTGMSKPMKSYARARNDTCSFSRG